MRQIWVNVSTHQCQLLTPHCHLFLFQGPQGFQGNPGETGEPGPAVSVPNLAGLEHKPTHMTHLYKHLYTHIHITWLKQMTHSYAHWQWHGFIDSNGKVYLLGHNASLTNLWFILGCPWTPWPSGSPWKTRKWCE